MANSAQADRPEPEGAQMRQFLSCCLEERVRLSNVQLQLKETLMSHRLEQMVECLSLDGVELRKVVQLDKGCLSQDRNRQRLEIEKLCRRVELGRKNHFVE